VRLLPEDESHFAAAECEGQRTDDRRKPAERDPGQASPLEARNRGLVDAGHPLKLTLREIGAAPRVEDHPTDDIEADFDQVRIWPILAIRVGDMFARRWSVSEPRVDSFLEGIVHGASKHDAVIGHSPVDHPPIIREVRTPGGLVSGRAGSLPASTRICGYWKRSTVPTLEPRRSLTASRRICG